MNKIQVIIISVLIALSFLLAATAEAATFGSFDPNTRNQSQVRTLKTVKNESPQVSETVDIDKVLANPVDPLISKTGLLRDFGKKRASSVVSLIREPEASLLFVDAPKGYVEQLRGETFADYFYALTLYGGQGVLVIGETDSARESIIAIVDLVRNKCFERRVNDSYIILEKIDVTCLQNETLEAINDFHLKDRKLWGYRMRLEYVCFEQGRKMTTPVNSSTISSFDGEALATELLRRGISKL